MSLQLLAKQMEAKGRKGDSMLVHMTTDEVAGLQKLAESAGGSLSVNPETGLVEANFLKRMLPTLVGLGVGAVTMNPLAGAAAGAAVGGYQAHENDQDVGLGALMGGLGGYGGASLAGGLGAAGAGAVGAAGTTAGAGAAGTAVAGQQAGVLTAEQIAQQQFAEQARQAALAEGLKTSGVETAQNVMQSQVGAAGAEGAIGEAAAKDFASQAAARPTMYAFDDGSTLSAFKDGTYTSTPGTDVVVAKPPATYSENFENFKRGFGEMGNKAGRTEFAKEFGMMEAGAGIAPLMAPGEKPEKAPVDDEMYSYTYDVGRTGAERTPSTSSAEREYFASRYSPLRKIRASEYGFAEGGEATTATTAATTAAPSASEAALAYLMGERSSSSAGLPALAAQTAASPRSNIGVGSDNMYAFDPATGTFLRNPYVTGATSDAVRTPVGTSFAGSDNGSSYEPVGPNPDFDTPEEQAAYYAENPTMGAITRAGQEALAFVPGGLALGAAQDYMDPGFRQEQAALTHGTVIDIGAPVNNQPIFQATPLEDLAPGTSNGSNTYALGRAPLNPDGSTPTITVSNNGIAAGSDLSGYSPSDMDNALSNAGYSDYGYNDSAPDMSDFNSPSDSGGWSPSESQDFGGGFDYGGSYDSYSSDYSGSDIGGFWKQGGLLGLAKGGMASGGFVVPADVVSALGNGSTDAGLRKLYAMLGKVKPIKGKGDGLSDSIKTSIDGKQPARVADGEAYIDPKTVKRLGGAKKLYAMMDKVRAQAHGKTTQQRKVNPAKVMA